MKQYLHKPTGHIFEYYNVNTYACAKLGQMAPKIIVESGKDWEEVKYPQYSNDEIPTLETFKLEKEIRQLKYKLELTEQRVRNLEEINSLLKDTNNMLRNWNIGKP